MSTQRGNFKKGPPKHKNVRAFKNDLHDTNHITKKINELEFNGICGHCKNVLDWKVKYKKYKLLTTLKKCVKCLEKKVRDSYYIVCNDCCQKYKICCKCSKACEDVQLGESEADRMRKEEEYKFELQNLKERHKRKFLRLLEKGVLTKESLLKEGVKALRKGGSDNGDEECDDDAEDDSDFDDLEEQMNYVRLREKEKQEMKNSENQENENNFDDDDDDYEDISEEEEEQD